MRGGSDREFRRLIHSLARFSELFVRHRNFYGAYIGVSGPRYVMMTIIAGMVADTVGEIAKRMSVSSQFVANEIGKLIEREIVEKVPNKIDRRSMILSLTTKGRNLFRELGPVRCQSNNSAYRSLSAERAKILQDILDALIGDIEISLHELDAPDRRGKRAPSASTEVSREETAHRSSRRRA